MTKISLKRPPSMDNLAVCARTFVLQNWEVRAARFSVISERLSDKRLSELLSDFTDQLKTSMESNNISLFTAAMYSFIALKRQSGTEFFIDALCHCYFNLNQFKKDWRN